MDIDVGRLSYPTDSDLVMMTPNQNPPLASHLERFRMLVRPGTVGNFCYCELIEIFASVDGISGPQNLFTIAVLEEQGAAESSHILNPKRLFLRGLKGWSFGICRSVMTLPDFEQVLVHFAATGIWSPTGSIVRTGTLHQIDPQFVPPDWSDSIPLNKILKNNFWAGSHILEWADSEKDVFKPFFDRASLLKELTNQIQSFVRVDLASVSDRLGNILIQIPVTVLIATCEPNRDNSGYQLQVTWRSGEAQRPLRATMIAEYDGMVTGFTTAMVKREPVELSLPGVLGGPKLFLLDEEQDVLVSATPALSFFSQIALTAHSIGRDEPRTFNYVDHAGQAQLQRIALRGPRQEMLVGEPRKNPNGGFTQKRLYLHDTERVLRERLFEQYGLPGCDAKVERARAIADLHHLIAAHGEEGAWLWDPYLDAIDMMETLFHSPHGGADLRGLSSGASRKSLSTSEYMINQRRILDDTTGNLLGLRLEYRIPYQVPSSEFHDRFLIFPKKQGGHLAWSLGTSVNSLGQAHHILQRADDGQRVSDAFQDLWDRMGPEQLVWKKP